MKLTADNGRAILVDGYTSQVVYICERVRRFPSCVHGKHAGEDAEEEYPALHFLQMKSVDVNKFGVHACTFLMYVALSHFSCVYVDLPLFLPWHPHQ